MVLADSHTISKSIDNDEKVDEIFESINDVDRPTIPKTRKDRQHKYKLYYSKDDDVVQSIKDTKPYSEVEKATDKVTVKPTPKPTTENAKRHKSPKRRVGSFWKKLRGKDKKKETEKHDSKDRRRRISYHKKDSHKIAYLTTKPGPGKPKAKKQHRKKLFLRQVEHTVSKRDASGLFSTRPYSNTPQSYKLQMGIAPQVDNMLKSKKCKINPLQPDTVAVATAGTSEGAENLQAELARIYSDLSRLKQRYGLEAGNNVLSMTPDNNPTTATTQGNIMTTTELDYQGTAQIDYMLRAMKSKAINMMAFQPSSATELSNSSATKATIVSNQPAPVSAFSALVSGNEIANGEMRTIARTGTPALTPKDSTINAITESHYLAARSIKEDAMTIAMNVEDLLQKELKSLYNKVKHKVSSDFRKEAHTIKSTLKEGYEKIASKLTSKTTKTSSKITTSHGPNSTTTPPMHRTCPCRPPPPEKIKEKAAPVCYPIPPRTTITTTAPRVKKKDEKEEDRFEDSFTSEANGKQTYDDYAMLSLYEQMLSKSHDENDRKLLSTPEFPIYAKNKREARRLSKRNPETLTDVKLTEVVRNIYDDSGNMPDYDYIDPAANVSSTGKTTASGNTYTDVDYVLDDSPGSVDYNDQELKPLENKPKLMATTPAPKKNYNTDNYARDAENSATIAYNTGTASDNPASETSFEGLSDKISYNQFVDGYKHYLKFQQELKNQNFSNLVKYQAHRHHSVDDIGKYILNKIPPLPTMYRRKRNRKFSDDSDNNMDYQEITTKSDDSWFRKHFYLFIDNGPPKKYHTSETVELKPVSADVKLYITDTTPTTKSKGQVFIRIDSKPVPRKTKNTKDISLDELSKILDSIKVKGTNHLVTKAVLPETQKEDPYMNMYTYNATDEATMLDSSFFGKFLGGRRRHASKKTPINTMYFPTTNYMYADIQQGRFKRSNTKESFENTLMADFMNKDLLEERSATTGTKDVFADLALTSNRQTNKYGFVDIDLVPRQTAIAKLRDNTKQSRIKNFFKKFHFKKDKTKKPKPKRAAYYNYYSPNHRRERFNPIKKLKDIFKNKEVEKDKDIVAPPFHTVDYDMDSEHMAYKPKFGKPLSIAEMQKQIPNITDTYFEPPATKHTTKEKENYYKLDEKDHDLLYNYHPSQPSTKPLITSIPSTPDKQIMETAPLKAKQPPPNELASSGHIITMSSSSSSSITKTPQLLRLPPCNVMTVNVKTLEPTKSSTRLIATETTSSPMAIDDMSVILEQMRKELRTSSEYYYPTITTLYTMYDHDPFDLQTEKYDYKKNVRLPLSALPEELSIRSKLTRFVKFPIRQRRYKIRRFEESEPGVIERDNSGIKSPSVLQYIHDLRGRNAVPSGKRKPAVRTLKKLHPHTYKPNEKQKSVYPDYFNDLLMWHHDILNLDSVPNPVWVNILKTLQTDTANSYTTPDMKNLMIELDEMSEFLGNNLNTTEVTYPTGTTEVKVRDHVGIRALGHQLDDVEGVIRSVAMDDNTIVTCDDILIKGEAKYFQYNKPKAPPALASSDFIRKLDNLNNMGDDKIDEKFKIKRKDPRKESPNPVDTPAVAPIIVDTTLMAYDDDVDSVSKELEVKKSCQARSSKKSGKAPSPVVKTEHTSVLKTNKAPVQYYTTPLPMKPQDFHRFLKDHQMGVDFVTAPIVELPTLIESWSTRKNQNKESETLAGTADPTTIFNNWNTEPTTNSTKTVQTTSPGSKSRQTSVNMTILPTKIENTKTLGKFSKTTSELPKRDPKVLNNNKLISKNSYWSEDFDRYKRFNGLKLTTTAATVKNKATYEPKYYGIFKKKMKDKLFDKKVTEQAEQVATDRLATEAVTVDPHNKEVEITIINFDDLDKMSTPQTFDTFVLPKKDEIHPFTEFSEVVSSDTTLRKKLKTTTQKEDNMHNELLYKDIFNERTTSTSTKEYSNTDLTKRTEYVDPLTVKDGQTITSVNKFRYPFEKAPISPNIFNKMPHGKNFNMPKRVHITSHHYKYDIFYDDVKKTVKNQGGEGCGYSFKNCFYCRINEGSFGANGVDGEKLLATFSQIEGWNTADDKRQIIGRAHRNRLRRRVWGPEAPHKKRKHFTFRGCKPKATGGLAEPKGYFEEPVLTSSLDNSADLSMSTLEDVSMRTLAEDLASVENTGMISLSRTMDPLTAIEDLVTMLDGHDSGVTKSDIDSEVTLAAIRTAFFSGITVRDSVRSALARGKATVTREAPVTTTTPATTPTTTPTTTTTETTTNTDATSVSSSPMPGSLIFDLNQLKKTSPSHKSHKDKEKHQGPQRDRHRRLFKFSALQSRLKSFMKNLTMTTKHVNMTTLGKATFPTPKCKSKRTCFKYIPDATKATATTTTEPTEEISDEREGFCITHHCEEPAPPHVKTAPTVRTTTTTTRTVCDPDALHYEDEIPTYHFECVKNHKSTTQPRHHEHHCTHHVRHRIHITPIPKGQEDVVYVEPVLYDDQIYEETVMSIPPTTTPPCEQEEPTSHCDCKREVQPITFTAKDVAALEVIVDLMKNTLNYEDNSISSGLHHGFFQPVTTRPMNANCSTNTIQVHIAIPYDYSNGKKRSPPSVPNPVRVRKIFSAKMSSPVDLEYQVHSIEGTMAPTSTKPVAASIAHYAGSLTPGMYLLIDKPKDGYGLKPLLGQISLTALKPRQLPSGTTASVTEAKPTDSRGETTSLKSLARVTLSKDFVAAINQQLLELYENRSRVYKDSDSKNTRKSRSIWRKLKEKKGRRKKGTEKYVVKRRIDWDVVKKYFGHDRVCNCKCKSNTAMCRACAASDAVIDELIFEFDNIGRYMADHCTEIQTFFWMNPIGGQKLRDSVNKIDKSLTDYCKRVKGKCQGRLCKTFSTYIDKRNFIKTAKTKKVEDISCLVNDLATLAHDLNMTVALNVCYDEKLKENGEKFINLMNNCINYKSLNKRSNPTTTPRQMVKQVYSLDNINVNIICNPESPSTAYDQMMTATMAPHTSSQQIADSTNDHLLDFVLEENKGNKRKGFGHFFPKKNKKLKLLSYFDFNKKHYKRQVDNQASMPLISDGGGAFWYDYLKAGTNEPRLARDSIKDEPTITVDVVQGPVTTGNVLKLTEIIDNNDLGKDTIYMTDSTMAERNPRELETTTDSLSRNIHQMLQLFGSLQDVESMNNNTKYNLTTNLPINPSYHHRKVAQDTSKKISLVDKVKQKVDKTLAKNRTTATKATTSLKTQKTNKNVKTALEEEIDELSTIEHTIEAVTHQAATTKIMTDGSGDHIVVISSITACKISGTTSPSTTNNSSTTVSLVANTTASNTTAALNNAVTSTTATIRGVAPKGDKNTAPTPVANKTTTKFGFKNMIKAASKIFRKGQTHTTQTPKMTTKKTTTTELNKELTPITLDDFVDVLSSSPDIDYVVEENSQNTTENPTILIINDYGNQVSNGSMSDDMKENYKNLLLSIIQFETNNLNEEWDRIAYGGAPRRDETDIKRSVPSTPKTEPETKGTLKTTPTAASSEEYSCVETEPEKSTKSTKAPEGLLNKIASKIRFKVVNQKKVVKKASIRQPRKNNKRANFIRNRKLRINTYKQETLAPVFTKEACHTRRTTQPAQICDIQATFKHIQNLQKSVPTKVFENLVKNINCYKYRNADASFILPYKKRGKTWDWIRNRRSLRHFHNKIKDGHDFDEETYVVDIEDDSSDVFESFVKGDNGIYTIVKRQKRKVNLDALERGLRNIPTLKSTEDELYIMVGDSVTLDCGINNPVRTCDGKFQWKTDRKRMLEQDNVEMNGLTVAIHNVEPRNSGIYTCSLDHTVRRNVMLNVMDVPSFDVVFLPVYKTEDNCSYDDLIAIQRLGGLMANVSHCGRACSVRIDEPVCQRDRSTNDTMVRATAVISLTPRTVNCSLQCKRDIASSLVMLCAANAVILPSIRVEVLREGVNETLTPCTTCVRPVVTHTLRRKDTNGHQEYHQLSSLMTPGKVDVVLLCPAGYFLLSKYKLCSSCPPNTSSKAGDNACRTCPRGTRAEPGAATCHVVKIRRHRRYDWWWYPPCGYVVACSGVLFGCTACVLLSVIVHIVSRDAELPEHDGDDEEQMIRKPMPSVAYAHFPGAKPLSPSRVILPRFFRPSLTSSRATDSQETKFELWKERNIPPPLPPIDFDP